MNKLREKFRQKFRYTGNAQKDRDTMESWAKDRITTNEAIKRLTLNNGWATAPTVRQFILLAGDSGYKKDIFDYEGLKHLEELLNED